MKNTIILFLDFDGVLHPMSGHQHFKNECIAILSELLDEYPYIQVAITSSWREDKSLDELCDLLGPVIGRRVIGTTPIINEPFLKYVRYNEVMDYLKFSNLENTPWVALNDELGNYPPTAPVILTDRSKGLTSHDAIKIINLIDKLT